MSSEKKQDNEEQKNNESQPIELKDEKKALDELAKVLPKEPEKDLTEKTIKYKLSNGLSNGINNPSAKKQKLVLRYDQPEAFKSYALLPGLGIYDASSDSDSSSENSEYEDWTPRKYDLLGREIRS